MPTTPPKDRWIRPAAWAIIALGVAARLVVWTRRDILWHDEAALALTIVRRGFIGLLEPPDLHQLAPVGFMWLAELCTRLFGTGDLALRLVPLLAGIATPGMVWIAARRWIGGWCALLPVAIAALSHYAIFFASEFKPYAIDASLAAAALATLSAGERPRGRTLLAWAVGGSLAVWFSHPAAFVLAGAGLAILWNSRRDGLRGLLIPAVVILAWLGSFAAHLRLAGDEHRFMADFWREAGGFVPRSLDALPWTRDRIVEIFSNPLGIHFGVAGLVAALTGVVVLLHDRRLVPALALTAPLLAALAAASLERYPFVARLMLFVLPSLALLIGLGVAGLARTRSPAGVGCAAILAAILLQPLATTALDLSLHGREPQTLRPLLETLAREARDEDVLICNEMTAPVAALYAARFGIGIPRRELGYAASPAEARATLDNSTRGTRIWLLATPHLDEPALAEFTLELGPPAQEFRAGESWLLRFDPR